MKTCFTCKESKNESDFRKCGIGLQSSCKPCKRLYDKNYYANNIEKTRSRLYKTKQDRHQKIKLIINGLKTAPCTDCKFTFHPYCMDFDHLKDKEMNIGDMVKSHMSLNKIFKEILKCELVCANCHRLRTFNRLCSR